MNKSLLIVASLALGTTAIAQDMPAGAPAQGSPPMTNTPAPSMPSGTDSTMPSQSGMQPADPNAGGTMPPASDSGMTPPADPGMTPPPAGDTGMAPPAGGSMPMSSGSGAMSTDTSSYPKCSRGVTDKCVQTGGTGTMHHHMMRKRPH